MRQSRDPCSGSSARWRWRQATTLPNRRLPEEYHRARHVVEQEGAPLLTPCLRLTFSPAAFSDPAHEIHLKCRRASFSLEIFPKQDQRTGKGFGNLVKLPLGIHRGTGKPSFFVLAADRTRNSQFELLSWLRPTPAATLEKLAASGSAAPVVVHPRHAAWAEEYPELAKLEACCPMLGQVMATVRSGRELSLREEKILLSTIGHLPRARLLLHHLFSRLPEYSRPLLEYKISRVRGTVLGCRRIHSLLEHGGDLPCRFEDDGYPHPLRHLPEFAGEPEPRSEKVENLRDALVGLKTAIRQVERFMGGT